MHDFRMKLHAVEFSRLIGDGGKGRPIRCGNDREAFRNGNHVVAMAHPDLIAPPRLPNAIKQSAMINNVNIGAAEFTMIGRLHLAAKLIDHGLLPVADAKDRYAHIENLIGRARRRLADDGGRPSGKDNSRRVKLLEPSGGIIERDDFAVNPGLPDASRDQLGDLTAKVNDQNTVLHRRGLDKLTVTVQPVCDRAGKFRKIRGKAQLCFAL